MDWKDCLVEMEAADPALKPESTDRPVGIKR